MSSSSDSIEVVVPVYNEEIDLAKNIPILYSFLSDSCSYQWRIVVADNASTDGTPQIAQQLQAKLKGVTYLRIPQKGRGWALKASWGSSTADIVSYMDVDLSTGLETFPRLIEAVGTKDFDLAIGSRLVRGAAVRRSPRRELLSRGYMLLTKTMLFTHFNDAQCGFKAARREAVQKLLPLIRNNHWFFDTELLVLAEKRGLRIAEIPVHWREDPESRVDIWQTAWEDLRGLIRLRVQQPWRHR